MRKKRNKKEHWSDNSNARATYVRHLSELKAEKKKERERLKKICDFEKGEIVLLAYKNTEREERVTRINDKTYRVSFGDDDYVLIDKEQLSGYPNSVIKETTGDGRRFVGELVFIKKIIDND